MYRPKDTSVVAHEQLLADHDDNGSPTGLGEPTASRLCSWKDYIVIVSCLISYTVAILVAFVPNYAVYWGQNRQFIWVGLCLTLMGWCAQFPLRRLFLTSSTNSRASTLQSMDAILRSDPTTARADWRVRILLTIMLGIGPALSASYKSLGGGQSQYVENDAVGQFGMIGPPGTQNIGFGISQFINATLPWFKDPGFPDRVYGFNMHVASENVTAMLDGPMPDYVESIQASLRPEQFKIITAEVSALVCEQRSQLSQSPEWFLSLYNNGSSDGYTAAQGQWVYNTSLHIAMMFPDVRDNTNIVVSGWSSLLNETFGHDLRQYSLSRQSYTGSWHVTKTSVELISAIRGYRRIDDRGLLSSNFLSFVDLYSKMLAEYDWRYRSTDHSPSRYVADVSKYRENIKSDSTFLASMVWSRIAAADGPEAWAQHYFRYLSRFRQLARASLRHQCHRRDSRHYHQEWLGDQFHTCAEPLHSFRLDDLQHALVVAFAHGRRLRLSVSFGKRGRAKSYALRWRRLLRKSRGAGLRRLPRGQNDGSTRDQQSHYGTRNQRAEK